jgi:hypothetical protein
VKKYYFEKDAQVTALQNMVANQRLSMSKTTLDDHEYTTRFEHLDGAIKELSYSIRNFWTGVPGWLTALVNKDAHTSGPREMTAVGRACISRWVFDEILDRYFHPKVEPVLSGQLKIIEKNIRRTGLTMVTGDEQRDDQIVKLTSWRLTTLEGLSDSMASAEGNEYKQQLTLNLKEKLSASLQMNLTDPPSLVLESGVDTIIDLSIGLACALPMESRDVSVEYLMPGSFINDTYMKVEAGIPLTNPGMNAEYSTGADQQQGDQHSSHSEDSSSLNDNEGERETNSNTTGSGNNFNNGNNMLPVRGDSMQRPSSNGVPCPQQQFRKDDGRKKSLFGGLVSGGKKAAAVDNSNGTTAPTTTNNPPGAVGPTTVSNNRMGSAGSGVGLAAGATPGPSKEQENMEKLDRDRRIRFAAFLSVEVRGKGKECGNVLVRAPCYSF